MVDLLQYKKLFPLQLNNLSYHFDFQKVIIVSKSTAIFKPKGNY